jgi:hypothetical protein
MSHRLVRACQVLTAGAALFAVLWACGNPPTEPSPPGLADLAGTWDGRLLAPPDPELAAHLVIVVSGGSPAATLEAAGVTYVADDSRQGTLAGVNFVLHVRNGSTPVTLIGQISRDKTQLTGRTTGLPPVDRGFTFIRR